MKRARGTYKMTVGNQQMTWSINIDLSKSIYEVGEGIASWINFQKGKKDKSIRFKSAVITEDSEDGVIINQEYDFDPKLYSIELGSKPAKIYAVSVSSFCCTFYKREVVNLVFLEDLMHNYPFFDQNHNNLFLQKSKIIDSVDDEFVVKVIDMVYNDMFRRYAQFTSNKTILRIRRDEIAAHKMLPFALLSILFGNSEIDKEHMKLGLSFFYLSLLLSGGK